MLKEAILIKDMNARLDKSREQKLLAEHRVLFLARGGDDKDQTSFYIEEIHARAETMTPLLKEILDFRPRPFWSQ